MEIRNHFAFARRESAVITRCRLEPIGSKGESEPQTQPPVKPRPEIISDAPRKRSTSG
jgi:hypothetical protein